MTPFTRLQPHKESICPLAHLRCVSSRRYALTHFATPFLALVSHEESNDTFHTSAASQRVNLHFYAQVSLENLEILATGARHLKFSRFLTRHIQASRMTPHSAHSPLKIRKCTFSPGENLGILKIQVFSGYPNFL